MNKLYADKAQRCNPPPGVPARPRIARSDQRAGRDHCIVYRSTGKPIVFGTLTFLRSHSLPGNLALPPGDQRVRAHGRAAGDPPQFGSRDGHREFFILVVQQHGVALGQVVVRQQQHQRRGELFCRVDRSDEGVNRRPPREAIFERLFLGRI